MKDWPQRSHQEEQLLSVTDLKACPIREWISAIRVCDVLFGWIDP
jgi:hypothetical protein